MHPTALSPAVVRLPSGLINESHDSSRYVCAELQSVVQGIKTPFSLQHKAIRTKDCKSGYYTDTLINNFDVVVFGRLTYFLTIAGILTAPYKSILVVLSHLSNLDALNG